MLFTLSELQNSKSRGSMAIVRKATPRGNFTIVRNELIQDMSMSLRARGLLIYLLSLPDDWRTDSVTLSKENKEGRDAIRTALQELEDSKYLQRTKIQLENGQWITEWLIFDHPVDAPLETTEDGFPVIGSSGTIQRTNTKNLLKELQPSVAVTARDVVACYVDKWAELHGEPPLPRQLGQLAREARVMLESGANPEKVLLSAEKCATDGHARLDSAYAWITAEHTRGSANSARTTNLNQGVGLVQKFQEQEQLEVTSETF